MTTRMHKLYITCKSSISPMHRCSAFPFCSNACAGVWSCKCCADGACRAPQSIMEACVADIQAVFERDPACDRYTQCILYFKGFQAIQCHRIAHWLWTHNRRVRLGCPRARAALHVW